LSSVVVRRRRVRSSFVVVCVVVVVTLRRCRFLHLCNEIVACVSVFVGVLGVVLPLHCGSLSWAGVLLTT